MAYKTIEVSPFVMADQLQFRIRNTSNSDIELLMLEAWVPRRYVYPAQGNPLATFGGATAGGFVHGEFTKRDGGDYLWFACTSQRGIFGGKPPGLRPVLTPTMGAIIPKMQIRLEPNQPQGASPDQPIYYQIHAVDHPTEQKKIMWAELLAGT
jgi:hypothetical protein